MIQLKCHFAFCANEIRLCAKLRLWDLEHNCLAEEHRGRTLHAFHHGHALLSASYLPLLWFTALMTCLPLSGPRRLLRLGCLGGS